MNRLNGKTARPAKLCNCCGRDRTHGHSQKTGGSGQGGHRLGSLAENLGFAPIKLGGLSEGGLFVQARGNSWGRSISRVRSERATADSVYKLASVTKTFIGAMAARAMVERRMALDGDFRVYLPGSYLILFGRGYLSL